MIKGEVPAQVQTILHLMQENARQAGWSDRAIYASDYPSYEGANQEIRIGHNYEVGFPTLVFREDGWFSRDLDGRDSPITHEEAVATASCFFTG